jgi:hypothetical protein
VPDSGQRDRDFAKDIGFDVLQVLRSNVFFVLLDQRLSPAGIPHEREVCKGSYEITTRILRDLGMDAEEIRDVTAVLALQGACCDCEVLYNVAEESRLKADYWTTRATDH